MVFHAKETVLDGHWGDFWTAPNQRLQRADHTKPEDDRNFFIESDPTGCHSVSLLSHCCRCCSHFEAAKGAAAQKDSDMAAPMDAAEASGLEARDATGCHGMPWDKEKCSIG